jgi:hypothetical protein
MGGREGKRKEDYMTAVENHDPCRCIEPSYSLVGV